jgi:NADH dehydrogenase/putative oxidoreductase
MLNAVVWPPLELLMRLWLARIFFVSGFFNLMHSQALMMISGHELPMPLPVPVAIAHGGGAIQFAASIFLACGAMTRNGSFIGPGHTVLQWLPLAGLARVPRNLVWIAGASLFFGAGTRYAALTLILVVSAAAMMHPHMMDVMTLCALLTLFVVRGGGIVSLDRVIDKLLHGLLMNHTRVPMRREMSGEPAWSRYVPFPSRSRL